MHVPSLDLNPADLLAACIKLLERMREQTNASTAEKSVIAIPKYMTAIENPFVCLREKLIYMESALGYNGIGNRQPSNEVSKHSNFKLTLFSFKDGSLPTLSGNQEVPNGNISVVQVGKATNVSARMLETVEDMLAYDTAVVTKAYIDVVCNKWSKVKNAKIEGVTGDFNMANLESPRENVVLTINRGLTTQPVVVGNITITKGGITIEGSFDQLFTFSDEEMKAILTSRSVRLAVTLAPPFAMLSEKAAHPLGTPTSCLITDLSGLSVDIVREILAPLKLADMAVGEFAVLPQLKDNFDFISNFLYFTFSILEKPLANTETTSFWLFFKPLSAGTWIMMVFCCFVAALVLATLNYFSPNQVDYGFIESIFVTFGCLFQGLTVSPPNTWSSRFMQCVWWLFVLFFIVIYIANYAAIIMNNGIQSEATGFTALLVDPSTPFGAIPNSMAAAQLDFSRELEIQKINYLSNKLYPQDSTSDITIEDRVKEVSEGKYRLIGDSFSLEYFASNYCLAVSGEFSSQQYAFILKKGTVYTTFLNSLLTNLTNKGSIKTIIDKYITPAGISSCTVPIKPESTDEGLRHTITLTEVAGIFILMLIGIAVAIILSVVECLLTRKMIVSATLVPCNPNLACPSRS
ncbi:unnamed protein product [Hydatigera taeniaeformis]|uniref:PBPe domain-containing protein n=1 Tax=Hydatigena taeniaeformis TaxID=6205 RepID=A0A0R3X4N1_HYDTA|nr:unnamed protein product [Hydatigera taeniaeformis]